MKIDLTGGAYLSRSVLASQQRCLNLYQEQIDPVQGEPTKTIDLPTPGLTQLCTLPGGGPVRGVYCASNGDLYVVAGILLFWVDSSWTPHLIGTLNGTGSNTSGPVKMADNGTNLLIVDGTLYGYTVLLASHSGFKRIQQFGLPTPDPNIIVQPGFYGSNYIDFIDTFFIAHNPGTPNFYISDSESIDFDPLQFAGKSSSPDPIKAAIVCHRQVYLFGTYTTEVWANTGGDGIANAFPFSTTPGVAIDWGAAATYSPAKAEDSICFLGQNKNGQVSVLMTTGYTVHRISTHAVEAEISTYSKFDDAVGFCYLQQGHSFYVLNFPSADKTWVYDISSKLWHERCYLDTDGNEHRHRALHHAFAYNTNVVGDYGYPVLYKLDLNVYTDNGRPVKRLRTFPQVVDASGNARIAFKSFVADMDVGETSDPTADPQISLRYSDDKGNSWSNAIDRSLGKIGQYDTNIKWNRLGMGRNRVFELQWSANALTALAGAYVQVEVSKS